MELTILFTRYATTAFRDLATVLFAFALYALRNMTNLLLNTDFRA